MFKRREKARNADKVVIDLFSGAGGLAEGFWKEGFRIAAHVEMNRWACETLKTRICFHFLNAMGDLGLYFRYLNLPQDYKQIDTNREVMLSKYPELKKKLELEVINRKFGNPDTDVNASATEEIIEQIERSLKHNSIQRVNVIIGGPPCQAYSIVGRSRMRGAARTDRRNFLFHYYMKVVEHFRPEVFVFENVPGILSALDGRIFTLIQEEFARIGYTVLSGPNKDHRLNVLNARDFGVYQNRKRVILFGLRSDLELQYPDLQKHAFDFGEEPTTLRAIGDLPRLEAGEGYDFAVTGYPAASDGQLSNYQRYMRKDSPGIFHHRARPVNSRDRLIYRIAIEHASKGMQLKYPDLPEHLKTHRNETSFVDRFKVHWWHELPHTIVAHIAKDGHYNIHPDIRQCRSLTVREAARIQSFPDNYRFEGPRTQQYIQVGNAVPPLMAQVIARAVKEECLSP